MLLSYSKLPLDMWQLTVVWSNCDDNTSLLPQASVVDDQWMVGKRSDSHWLQSSRMLLIMSEIFPRCVMFVGCHLTDVFWSLLHFSTDIVQSKFSLAAVITYADDVWNVPGVHNASWLSWCVLESAAFCNWLSSDSNSHLLQSSRMLLIITEMFQRYVTLAGYHLTAASVFKKNLEFIETSCNNFITYWQHFIWKKKSSHFTISYWKKKSPHSSHFRSPSHPFPCNHRSSSLFALWLSVYQALAIGSGKRKRKKKKKEKPPILNI